MKLIIPILVTLLTIFSGCVTAGKYDAMVFSKDSLQKEFDSLLNFSNQKQTEFDSKSKGDNQKIVECNNFLNKLRDELDKAKAYLEQIKASSSDESKSLTNKIDDLELMKLKLEALIQKKDSKLEELNSKLKAREDAMNSLRDKLNKALLGFTEGGLTVSIKDGKVYVSLSNQLLFKSGSTAIDKKGQEALFELSKVLNQQKDLNILVEGHTDNQAIAPGAKFQDNWDLSVLRSTEVIRYLTLQGSLDPTRIVASGRGEFYPIQVGDSKEERAMNRRTEIILTPKLDEIMNLLNK
ncbi:MAG: OmpA family protein [Candidatus Kapabacteria bacterium]|nr:OmpA family protein [Candidatus Kapabacteria bacterium]